MIWLINNIDTIIGILALIIAGALGIYKFIKLGKEQQIRKIKQWLLFAVVESEKALGGGTGQVKLRYCYDMFVDKFKFMTLLISFEEFSSMVDEALETMRNMLSSNEKVKDYVENK